MLAGLSCHIIKLRPGSGIIIHTIVIFIWESQLQSKHRYIQTKTEPIGTAFAWSLSVQSSFTYNDNKYEVCNLLVSLFQSLICYLWGPFAYVPGYKYRTRAQHQRTPLKKIEFHTINKDFEQTVQFCFLLLTIFHKQERTLRIKWVTWLDHPLIQLKPIMQRQSLDILHFNFINSGPRNFSPWILVLLHFLNTFPTYRKCRNYI